MPDKGDVFDLGTNEYIEYLDEYDRENDLVIHYTREPAPSLAELKVYTLIKSGNLDGEYRKVGPNEKNRLALVYSRAKIMHSPELKAERE